MKPGWFKKRPVTERAAIIGGILSIIGVVLASLIGAIPDIFQPIGESALQLVDISFIESDEFPKLDIKLRNTGEKVAFLKQADFEVQKIWTLKPFPIPSYVDVSYNYDVVLPISGAPYSKSIVLHQRIEPNTVDRFTITLGNDAPFGSKDYVFLMTVKLIYDEDDKCLASQNLLFVTQAEDHPPADYEVLIMYDKNRVLEYKRLVAEFDEMDVTKNKCLESLIRTISEIPIEDK